MHNRKLCTSRCSTPAPHKPSWSGCPGLHDARRRKALPEGPFSPQDAWHWPPVLYTNLLEHIIQWFYCKFMCWGCTHLPPLTCGGAFSGLSIGDITAATVGVPENEVQPNQVDSRWWAPWCMSWPSILSLLCPDIKKLKRLEIFCASFNLLTALPSGYGNCHFALTKGTLWVLLSPFSYHATWSLFEVESLVQLDVSHNSIQVLPRDISKLR